MLQNRHSVKILTVSERWKFGHIKIDIYDFPWLKFGDFYRVDFDPSRTYAFDNALTKDASALLQHTHTNHGITYSTDPLNSHYARWYMSSGMIPTVILQICACVKQVLIGWKLIFWYKIQWQQIHHTMERFSTSQMLGDILYPGFWLVENHSTVMYLLPLDLVSKSQPSINQNRHNFVEWVLAMYHCIGCVSPCIVWNFRVQGVCSWQIKGYLQRCYICLKSCPM